MLYIEQNIFYMKYKMYSQSSSDCIYSAIIISGRLYCTFVPSPIWVVTTKTVEKPQQATTKQLNCFFAFCFSFFFSALSVQKQFSYVLHVGVCVSVCAYVCVSVSLSLLLTTNWLKSVWLTDRKFTGQREETTTATATLATTAAAARQQQQQQQLWRKRVIKECERSLRICNARQNKQGKK